MLARATGLRAVYESEVAELGRRVRQGLFCTGVLMHTAVSRWTVPCRLSVRVSPLYRNRWAHEDAAGEGGTREALPFLALLLPPCR